MQLGEWMSDVIWTFSNASHNRPDNFQTVLEWPLCAVCSVFCFVLSLFHLRICFSLRLFLFCQGRLHFLQVTSYRARYIFFLVGKFLSDIWSGRLAFFVGHFEKMSDCPTSLTNFDSTDDMIRYIITYHRAEYIGVPDEVRDVMGREVTHTIQVDQVYNMIRYDVYHHLP